MGVDLERCVDFARQLIRTESLPGQEGELAGIVRDELTALGYQDVAIDEVGNVLGRVPGRGEAPATMFNTHLDHVDVGDHDRWPHPPFGAEVHDGKIWGRGAVDIKGPLAAQVHGVARLIDGPPPPGDVWVTAVVQEEIGGVGARHLAHTLDTPVVVIGEPSGNTLRRGHRGRSELIVHVRGRSVHASVPEKGVNPWYSVAPFLAGLDGLAMPSHEDLGRSTVAATLMRTDQTSGNVVPGEIWLTCDWRHVPGESAADARAKLDDLLASSLQPGASGSVEVPLYRRTTWTGENRELEGNNPAYILAADHPVVLAARRIVEPMLGPVEEVGTWRFATDGGHFAQAGMACIGLGPGDELLAHTVDEHIEIAALEAALELNERLARELAVAS